MLITPPKLRLKFSYQRIKTTFIVKNVKVIVKNGLSACNNIRKMIKRYT